MTNIGLPLTVMHPSSDDHSNGGVSSTLPFLLIVGRIVDGVVEPIPDTLRIQGPCDLTTRCPAREFAVLKTDGVDHLVPVLLVDGRYVPFQPAGWVGPMHGGNIVMICPEKIAFINWLDADTFPLESVNHGIFLQVHDRFEKANPGRARTSCKTAWE